MANIPRVCPIRLDSVMRETPTEELELDSFHSQTERVDELPPVDGGWGAWTYLAAATGLETLVWGFVNSYGVFLEHYSKTYNNDSSLPLAGTIAMGEMYLLLPPLTFLLGRYPRYRAACMWAGLGLLTISFISAGLTRSVPGIIATQGVLYGIGGTMLYCPTTAYMFEWWSRKRGLASGIMFSGTGLGGLVMPIISASLLTRWGQRTTLVSIGIGYAILLGALIPFIRPRLPLTASSHSSPPRLDTDFLRRPPFWMLWLGVLFQGLAAFMPGTYLPAYANALQLPSKVGTLSVALMNLARVPGQVVIGHISDKLGARTLIIGMAFASGLTVMTGWGLAKDAGGIIGFAIAFGGFAGSYTALFPRFIATITHDDPHLPAILYALFSFARGIGSIASGPLSTALLNSPSNIHLGAAGWGGLILWTGAGMLGSSVGAGYKSLKMD